MECAECAHELPPGANFCSACGQEITGNDSPSPEDQTSDMAMPTGFGRTLSTELLLRQEKIKTFQKVEAMMECCHYGPGDVVIKKGAKDRDLYLLTEGKAEVIAAEENHDILLNEVNPPYVLGDLGCLLGIPRTATIRAQTPATVFILRYEILKDTIGDEPPEWFNHLLSSFVSGIKSLNSTISSQEQELLQLRQQLAGLST